MMYLLDFEGRGQGQGHSEVKYLSELLLRPEAYTSTLGR